MLEDTPRQTHGKIPALLKDNGICNMDKMKRLTTHHVGEEYGANEICTFLVGMQNNPVIRIRKQLVINLLHKYKIYACSIS